MAPVLSDTNNTFSQLAPPSVERYTPRSELGAKALPKAATKTTFGLLGWISTAPIWPTSSSPTRVHVFPASVDL